ncbi:hypothetical protein GCM10027081_44240 [Cupriavidus yeoncheonensis]
MPASCWRKDPAATWRLQHIGPFRALRSLVALAPERLTISAHFLPSAALYWAKSRREDPTGSAPMSAYCGRTSGRGGDMRGQLYDDGHRGTAWRPQAIPRADIEAGQA